MNDLVDSRALVVSGGFIDADPKTGGGMRRSHILRGVQKSATVDVFVVDALPAADLQAMEDSYAVRAGCSNTAAVRPSRLSDWWRGLVGSTTAFAMTSASESAVRQAFAAWQRDYEVTVVRIEQYIVLRPLLQGTIIVDMDDLVSQVVLQKRKLMWRTALSTESSRRLSRLPPPLRRTVVIGRRLPRLIARDLSMRLEGRRWTTAERFVVNHADVLMVSNQNDLDALGSPASAVIVPNGFTSPGVRPRKSMPGSPPTIGFWGPITYGPNADAARWLISEVLPILRRTVPDVRVVIVGRGSENVVGGGDESVTAAGFVDDLGAVLEHFDVAVVPLRLGAGTRIKILEAWASGLPVVSTSVGCYGLDYAVGSAIVRADGATNFARAVTAVLADPALYRSLVDNGVELSKGLTWERSEGRVAELVELHKGNRSAARRS